jgi:hypothetical protein
MKYIIIINEELDLSFKCKWKKRAGQKEHKIIVPHHEIRTE